MSWTLPIGATPRDHGVDFRVWAPDRRRVEVVVSADGQPSAVHPLRREAEGYWAGTVADASPGTCYMYRLDGATDRPDPASRHQPVGVHGASMVVDPAFAWSDADWRGLRRDELIVYELHVGTATPAGTFEALIERLADLRALGVTALELMPVADFPGERNWGYDGVDLYAPARAYGGAAGLKRLVDAAHAAGLAVLLDVVYNHLGPDGNYLRDYTRAYFTARHHTPWGEAINYDGPGSAEVRAFVIDNALYWAHEYHVDGLRLDATHAIVDDSPTHLLQEMAERVRASLPADRHFLLIAEDERNEARLLQPVRDGGMGLDGVWADDFHHSVRVTLSGESDGYYRDYAGGAGEIAKTVQDGWLYQGQASPHTGQARGTVPRQLPLDAFVYCIQNHDQIGNRALGTRLNHEVGLDAYRAASALLLLAPQTPMLFMGQEWAATSPFQFFTDHEPELGRMVTAGRREEFKHFQAFSMVEVPDPQAGSTFERSKLRWDERQVEPHAGMLRLYVDLIALRRELPACRDTRRESFDVRAVGDGALILRRSAPEATDDTVLVVANLRGSLLVDLRRDLGEDVAWRLVLDTEGEQYRGGRSGSSDEHAEIRSQDRIRLEGPRALVFVGRPHLTSPR